MRAGFKEGFGIKSVTRTDSPSLHVPLMHIDFSQLIFNYRRLSIYNMISTSHMLIYSNLREENSCFPIAAGQTHLILDTRLISSPPINIVQHFAA